MASYRFPGEQSEDAESLLGQVAVGLHAVPIGELKDEKVPAVLRAHGLRQQQGQTVVSWTDKQFSQRFHYRRENVSPCLLSATFNTHRCYFLFEGVNLTFLLGKSARLADAVSRQVAENRVGMVTFPGQSHLLLHPVGGTAGQPGREAPPPLQLLLVLAEHLGLLIRGAQPAPQRRTQSPDLGPVPQQRCSRESV